VNPPFFAASTELGGEDEVQEASYIFSHFFREKRWGRDVFITLRVPNPTVEKAEAKILLETLEGIPRSFDAAKLLYGEDIPPGIF
jgi:phosphoenolpyruvate carboxylase